jgi:serine/threonine protein kinase
VTNPDSGSRDHGSRRVERDDIEKTILSSKDAGAGKPPGFDSERTVPTGGPNTADGYSPTVTHYDPERTIKSDLGSDAAPVMPLPTKAVDFTQPQIPGYEMIEKIGEGGMGIVFKANQTSLNRLVAIKVVKAAPGVQGLEYEEFVKRFRREALAGAKLNHQNIVSIYDHGVANGVIYMALEFVDGPTAAKVVRKEGRMPVRQALGVVRDCVLGLSHAHAKGIIHRDVKPANILLQSSGAEDARGDSRMLAKIADLGLSRFGDRQTPELNNLTRAGTFLGSPDHMAPEQADGRNVDFRSDIYALGSTLYYLVTGRSPFRGESEFDLVMKKTTSRAENPQDLVGGISDDFVLVLDRMMARKPEMRYGSYQELLHDLDALLIDGHPATPPVMRDQASIEDRKSARPKAPTKLIATQKKKRGMIIAAAAVIVVLGGAGAYFVMRPNNGGGGSNSTTSSPKDKFFTEFGAAKIEDLIKDGAGWRTRYRDLLAILPEAERGSVDEKYRSELKRRLSAFTTEAVQKIEGARNERQYVAMADSAKDVVAVL